MKIDSIKYTTYVLVVPAFTILKGDFKRKKYPNTIFGIFLVVRNFII